MEDKLECLRDMLNKKRVYSLNEVKERIQVFDNEELIPLFSKLIHDGIYSVKGHAFIRKYKYINKGFDLLNACLTKNIVSDNYELINMLEEASNHVCKMLKNSKRYEGAFCTKEVESFLRKIKDNIDITIVQASFNGKNDNEDVFDACNLVDYLIYEIKNYELVEEIFKRFPTFTKLEGLSNNFFIKGLVDKYLECVESNKEDTIYYGRVIKFFISLKNVHITKEYKEKIVSVLYQKIDDVKRNKKTEDLKKTIFFLNELIMELKNIESFDYNEKIKSINYKYGIQSFDEEICKRPIIELKPNEEYIDFTDKHIISIDTNEAVSYDDAFSCEKLDNGNILLGVYISDVDFYIPSNSLLDKEAYKRAQTIYTPNGIEPMIPLAMHTDICSLNIKTNKPVIAYMFEFTPDYELISRYFKKAIIKVDSNLSYERFNQLIARSKDSKELQSIKLMINIAEHLHNENPYKELYHAVKEIKRSIKKNDEKSGYNYDDSIGGMIVQEFKILSNTIIATNFYEKKLPFIYRVNEFHVDDNIIGEIRHASNGNPKLDDIIDTINSIYNKSYYSTENVGHFGLNLSAYAHSTTPIRNYSALINQRIMKDLMLKQFDDKEVYHYEDELPQIAKHINEQVALNDAYLNEIKKAYGFQKRLTKNR